MLWVLPLSTLFFHVLPEAPFRLVPDSASVGFESFKTLNKPLFCFTVSDIGWSVLSGIRVSGAWAHPRLSHSWGIRGRYQRVRCAVSSPRGRVSPLGPDPSPGPGFRFTWVSSVASICLRGWPYTPAWFCLRESNGIRLVSHYFSMSLSEYLSM